jgi:hypothetical protein
MLLNVVIPISTATVKDGPGECRGAEDSGRVPFDVSFTCTRTTGGQTGCSYSGQFALDLLAGTKRKYLCDKAWSGAIPQPDQVQVLLSGVQADTGSKMKHHNFRVSIKLDAYNVSTYVADWTATVEWEDRADVMVDSFDVTVHANLHWSATGDIRFQELSLACASTSGADCTTSSGFNVGAGNTLGGLAFGELSLSADNATTGMEPDGFLASLECSEAHCSVGSAR